MPADLDYKDLFRDAVHMLAYIARAAGFHPDDPTVEPPAIVARVERLRAERDALQARLDALAAPVEEVDVEAVLRLDSEATPGPWHARAAHTENGYRTSAISLDRAEDDGFSPEGLALFGRTITVGVSGHDAHLIATYRTAAPALAREVVALRAINAQQRANAEGTNRVLRDQEDEIARLRDALATAEQERDRLHDRIEGALSAALGDPVMSIHDGDGPTAPDLESLIKLAGQIRRERDELRLTLAAERGEP